MLCAALILKFKFLHLLTFSSNSGQKSVTGDSEHTYKDPGPICPNFLNFRGVLYEFHNEGGFNLSELHLKNHLQQTFKGNISF